VIRVARVSGGLRVRVIKIRLRLARLSNGWVLDRDIVGALNIGLRALSPGGRGVASPSTEPHAVWAKLVNSHRGLAQTTEIRIIKSASKRWYYDRVDDTALKLRLIKSI